MKRKRYAEEQTIKVLKEQEGGRKIEGVCSDYSIAMSTFYKWKCRFGGMPVY